MLWLGGQSGEGTKDIRDVLPVETGWPPALLRRPMNNLYKLIGKLPVPCFDVLDWARWYETAERTVAQTHIGPLRVSTVFLGIDHGFRVNRVRLFETMIFGDQDHMIQLNPNRPGRLMRSTLDYQERYETWAEAEAGHARACDWAKAELVKIDARVKNDLNIPPDIAVKPPEIS